MPFTVGDAVVVRALGNKRGDVIAVGRDGRYQLRIDGVTMWCRDADLAAPAEARKRKGGRNKPQPRAHAETDRGDRGAANPSSRPAPSGRVDLHGLVVEDAIARMVAVIDRSLLQGADRVEVVHGKGSGRVRDAVHRYLTSMPVVAAFRLDPTNAGVTWVYFR